MSRNLDFQKREAKQSLWDNDGFHIGKKWRNKGKGRGKDKRLIERELDDAYKADKNEPERGSEYEA